MTLTSRFNLTPETELEKLTRLVTEAEAEVKRAKTERDRRYQEVSASGLRELMSAVARAEIARDAARKALGRVAR